MPFYTMLSLNDRYDIDDAALEFQVCACLTKAAISSLPQLTRAVESASEVAPFLAIGI